MLRRLTRERFLSEPELAAFMSAVRERRHKHQPRDYALFALLANTGMRPGEARALRRSDVRLGASPVVCLHRRPSANGVPPVNVLPLHGDVARVLRAYCESMEPGAMLFPFTKRQGERLFRYYASKAGLLLSHRMYSLRHTFGWRLWERRRDLRAIQAIMGHRWLKTARAYVHAPASTMRAVLDAAALRG